MRNDNWIHIFSGRKFYPCDPRPEEIDIIDIAHALSMLCRFTGHTKNFYSVAQHSAICSCIVPRKDARWGLLHDAPEAYLADIARPIKPLLTNYKQLETQLLRAVAERFDLPWPMPESIHEADDVLVCTERRDLLRPGHDWGEWTRSINMLPDAICPIGPAEAEEMFIARYLELFPISPAEAATDVAAPVALDSDENDEQFYLRKQSGLPIRGGTP